MLITIRPIVRPAYFYFDGAESFSVESKVYEVFLFGSVEVSEDGFSYFFKDCFELVTVVLHYYESHVYCMLH